MTSYQDPQHRGDTTIEGSAGVPGCLILFMILILFLGIAALLLNQ